MTRTLALPSDSRLRGLSADAIRSVVEAAQALDLGRADEAERHIIALLARHAEHPEVLRLLAGLQNLRGEAPAAAATMQRALAARPDDALYVNTLGSILLGAGRYDEAIAELRRACELDPKLAAAWFNLGLALMRSLRIAESAAAFRQVLALSPQHDDARIMLADMLRAQGRTDEAATEYRRVLARAPTAGMAWWGLADLKTRPLTDADVAQLRRALQQPGIGEPDRIAMGFALAKALDDTARHEESLHVLAEAHALARRHRPWNAHAHAAATDAVLAAFTPPPATADATLGSEVIFVASLPRSGSTLIEQILAAHSAVEGGSELPDLPLVLTEESQRRRQRFPDWVNAMRPEDWARLGRRYLERTAYWRRQRPRCVDKLPYNWFYVGAIRAMLPGARVVIARRDPLETCLSCYRQYLVDNDYAHTFVDLAEFWKDFDRATRTWHSLHPTHVRVQNYEALVADPEAQIRDLLQFCDLPFEEACLAFHQSTREVYTPSATQVREPLRRDTARAARYGALLDPLRQALGLPPFSA